MATNELRLTGTVRHLLKHDPATGFSILRVSLGPSSRDALPEGFRSTETVTVMGTLHGAAVNDRIRIVASPVQHAKFGWQLKAERILRTELLHRAGTDLVMKTGCFGRLSRDEMELAKRACPDLVRHLEEDHFDQNPPSGPQAALLRRVVEAFKQCEPLRTAAGFLDELGVGPDAINRILAAYGTQTIDRITRSPYRLLGVPGIGFKTADDIARRLGFAENSEIRLCQSMEHVVNQARERGDTVMTPLALVESASRLTTIPSREITQCLQRSIRRGRFAGNGGVIGNAELVRAEQEVADQLIKRIQRTDPLPLGPSGSQLDGEQPEAALTLLHNQLAVMTGGPGVGKTFVTQAVREAMILQGMNVLLCAPTGKAARRLSESTGAPAKTVHQLLEFAGSEGFRRHEHNLLEGDALILDEASMLDITLMARLLRAMPPNMRLYLVGDNDQIPSVDAGNVLGDIIDSGVVPVGRLTEPRRTAKGSDIVLAAHAILRGEMPNLNGEGDFRFLKSLGDDNIGDAVEHTVTQFLPTLGHDPMGVQVIAPQRTTAAGIQALNKRLQRALNFQEETLHIFGEHYAANDRIMQMHNDYERGLANGQTGQIAHVNLSKREAWARFDDRILQLNSQQLAQVRLAYATTIHKSQGSEYDALVVPITPSHKNMLTRRLIYTALTRGKQQVCFVGDPRALEAGIANTSDAERNTQLARLLREGYALKKEPARVVMGF